MAKVMFLGLLFAYLSGNLIVSAQYNNYGRNFDNGEQRFVQESSDQDGKRRNHYNHPPSRNYGLSTNSQPITEIPSWSNNLSSRTTNPNGNNKYSHPGNSGFHGRNEDSRIYQDKYASNSGYQSAENHHGSGPRIYDSASGRNMAPRHGSSDRGIKYASNSGYQSPENHHVSGPRIYDSASDRNMAPRHDSPDRVIKYASNSGYQPPKNHHGSGPPRYDSGSDRNGAPRYNSPDSVNERTRQFSDPNRNLENQHSEKKVCTGPSGMPMLVEARECPQITPTTRPTTRRHGNHHPKNSHPKNRRSRPRYRPKKSYRQPESTVYKKIKEAGKKVKEYIKNSFSGKTGRYVKPVTPAYVYV